MCLLQCGLGMEEPLVNKSHRFNLMEINKLADLNSLRTAPILSKVQKKTFRRTRN